MRFHLRDMTEMLDFTHRNKDLIFRIIHKRICESLHTQAESIFLFDVFLTDYSIVVENVALRSEWPTSLQLALAYFEEVEDYETCREIKNTLDILT
jgi:hypothetical protein